jgi:hypothetical protein
LLLITWISCVARHLRAINGYLIQQNNYNLAMQSLHFQTIVQVMLQLFGDDKLDPWAVELEAACYQLSHCTTWKFINV